MQAVIETEDDVDGEGLDAVGPDADRTTRAFASAVASLSAMRFGALDPELPADAEADIREAAQEEAAEELIAFEGLALGTRLSAILNDGDTRTFAAAAVCVLGIGWDPLADDPLNEDDLGALIAGLASARATLAMVGAAGGRDVAGIRETIDTAGVAIRNTTLDERDLLADANSAVAWNVAHALIAGFDIASMPLVRSSAARCRRSSLPGQSGVAGSTGPIAQTGSTITWTTLSKRSNDCRQEDLRQAVADDPLLAAYVAGRSWRLARMTGWRLPWDTDRRSPLPGSLGAGASGTT